MPAELTVCEQLKSGWYQSAPDPVCYEFTIEPSGAALVSDLNFGNWQPVDVTACKVRDMDGQRDTTDYEPVAGWPVYLSIDANGNSELDEGEIVDGPQYTLEDGCFTWEELTPGVIYNVEEGSRTGWVAFSDTVHFFDEAVSGQSYDFTFVNAPVQGCTPGFWQGGPDKPDAKAGGSLLWDGDDTPPWEGPFLPPPHVDAQWLASGGAVEGNPYIHDTAFSPFFTPYNIPFDGTTADYNMFELVDTGGGPEPWRQAARDLVAAYLNASWGMNYAYTTDQLASMWTNAVSSGDFSTLHGLLDAANNSMVDIDGDGVLVHQCPISASGW
jgi:hypothetical protein